MIDYVFVGFFKADGGKFQLNYQNGVSVLANTIAYPYSSPNPEYYGDYFSAAKNAIGNIVDPNHQNGVAPGPVANYATAARDPAYYQYLARIMQIFRNFQNKQGPYTQDQVRKRLIRFLHVLISNKKLYKMKHSYITSLTSEINYLILSLLLVGVGKMQ